MSYVGYKFKRWSRKDLEEMVSRMSDSMQATLVELTNSTNVSSESMREMARILNEIEERSKPVTLAEIFEDDDDEDSGMVEALIGEVPS